MEQEQYANRLPVRPDEATLKWAEKNKKWKEYLIYRDEIYFDPLEERRKHGARVVCTACGASAIYPKIPAGGCGRYAPAPFGVKMYGYNEISGNHVLCQECGAETELRHIGNIPDGIEQYFWFESIGRLDEKLVIFQWLYQRHTDKNGKSICEVKPYEAFVFEKQKAVRLKAYVQYMTRKTLTRQWQQLKNCNDTFGESINMAPWNRKILSGSTCENSKLDIYLKIKGRKLYPVSYLRLWQKRKAVENLLTAGAGSILAEMIADDPSVSGGYYGKSTRAIPKLPDVDWTEKQPTKMLGINRIEMQQMLKDKWTKKELNAYRNLREYGIKLEDMSLVRKYNTAAVQILADKKPRVGIMRILRYLEKQKSDVTILEDYWRIAARVGRDLSDISLYLPRNLERAHDQVVDEENERRRRETERRNAAYAEKRKKEKEKRAERFAERAKKFAIFTWEHKGLLIRPVENEDELMRYMD